MDFKERALAFPCQGDWLYGVASVPQAACSRGVLIVVGGPQYRGGSHRQFTLLARALAAQGIAAMRFDYRGMGDSQGAARDFDAVSDDLRAAIDQFSAIVPGMQQVVLWGLCDGASAALMYAPRDKRVTGLVLLNPWVRTDDGIARTTLKHYYRDRLLDADFWRQVVRGRFDYARSLKSLYGLVRAAFGPAPRAGRADSQLGQAALPDRLHAGMRQFQGQVLLIISGADLTGREFCDLTRSAPKWKRLLDSPRVSHRQLDGADHTFSRRAWRDQVADWTGEWVRSW
jgi:exosortase A-associated hydrolase 1